MADWNTLRTLEQTGQTTPLLEQLLAQGIPQTARDAYNLGTTLLQAKRPHEASAYLEWARALNTRQPELPSAWIETNLEAARTQWAEASGSAVLYDPSHPLELWAESPYRSWAEGVGCVLSLGAVLFLVKNLVSSTRSPLSVKAFATTCFFPALSLLLLGAGFWGEKQDRAYVRESITVKGGPSASYPDLVTLSPGTTLRILGSRSESSVEWLQIRHGKDSFGWVPAPSVLRIPSPSHRPES